MPFWLGVGNKWSLPEGWYYSADNGLFAGPFPTFDRAHDVMLSQMSWEELSGSTSD